MNINTILLIGRPGSGKGTQAKALADSLGWEKLSSGDSFKAIRDGEGPLADRVRALYDAGQLIPDWFPAYLFENTILNLPPEGGIVIEGFGRTVAQAQHLLDVISWLGRSFMVIHLDVSEDEALRRQVSRGLVEDRPDSDAEHKIRARFAEFTANTAPALEFFKEKGLLVTVDGEKTPEGVAEEITSALTA